MAMRIEEHNVDMRVIRLFQKNVRERGRFSAESRLMFSHYDAIEVSPVFDSHNLTDERQAFSNSSMDNTDGKGKKEDLLYQAYRYSCEKNSIEPHQTILAFTDVVKVDQDEKFCGYGAEGKWIAFNEKYVSEFWSKEQHPLFFLSMISLNPEVSASAFLYKLHSVFLDIPHLAYLTFDYCNVLLFVRTDSFKCMAELMAKVNYETNRSIVDSITMYSFSRFGGDYTNINDDVLDAYLRFSVQDIDVMNQYYDKLKEMEGTFPNLEVSKNQILGRHDVGIFCRNISLKGLFGIWEKTKEFEIQDVDRWYTAFTLSVMIRDCSIPERGKLSDRIDSSLLGTVLEQRLDVFRKVYGRQCSYYDVSVDNVWLRWLSDSCRQAVALLQNKMTRDLGLSLVPQFEDFLDYALKLWDRQELLPDKSRKEAERCFNSFFQNMSILVDSMNHHTREFIAAPPVRTLAFELPPKLMAFYTLYIHRLIDAFQDDEERKYGFTITPQCTRILSVETLTKEGRVLMNGDQYISIGISEESVYRISNTMAILAHELSHFVGWRARCRKKRYDCLLNVEIYYMILKLFELYLEDVYAWIGSSSNEVDETENAENTSEIDFGMDMISHTVNRLKADLYAEESAVYDDEHYLMDEVIKRISTIRVKMNNYYGMTEKLFDCVWESLIESDGNLLTLGKASYQEMLKITGLSDDLFSSVIPLMKQELRYIFYNRTIKRFEKLLKSEYWDENGAWITFANTFSEAFADVQSLILLKLSWAEYISLTDASDFENVQRSERNRILAVAVAVNQTEALRGWSREDLYRDSLLKTLMQLLKENKQQELMDYDVDMILVNELISYLKCCIVELRSLFQKAKKKRADELCVLYNTIKDLESFYMPYEKIEKMLVEYRKELLNNQFVKVEGV